MTDDELIEAMLDTWETANAGPLESMRAVLAVVRERDGRDAERWRFWCAHSYLFGVLLPFRGPDDMNAQIDAARGDTSHGRAPC